MQTRLPAAAADAGGPSTLLDRLFRVQDEGCHGAIAEALWAAPTAEDAASRLEDLARGHIERWEASDHAASASGRECNPGEEGRG